MVALEGKTAFVTGAASGIGLGIATKLAQAGMKVMLCDIDEEALDHVVVGLRRTNADVEGFKADVSVKAELQAAADKTISRYGKIHVLINNAGVVANSDYGSWTDATWNWVIGVNLMAVIWGVEIFGPLIELHKEGGHIVSTASVGGLYAGRHSAFSAYNVTKYGVVALSEGLRATLFERGIGVSVLCPGMVRTQILNSRRNLSRQLAETIADFPMDGANGEVAVAMKGAIEGGVDPLYVGELVREGIENGWFYIFTDTKFESAIEDRFAGIKQGFDKIRGRIS